MNILAKILFLFHCLPIVLPKSFFGTINQAISSILRQGKLPRIWKSIVQRCKFNGGLSLPNFKLYYRAACIQKTVFWSKSVVLPWCRLEAQSCTSSSLTPLLIPPVKINPSVFTTNPVVCSTLRIWFQFRRHFKCVSLSSLASLLRSHLLPPSFTDLTFSIQG